MQTGQFNTVPAVSDESMSVWMQYIYMQKPKPTNATGVPVHLTAIDPNGNFQDMGTITSDSSGTYGISYNPPVPGIYTITATFGGTESYFGSEAATRLLVTEAPNAQVTPTVTPTAPPTSVPTHHHRHLHLPQCQPQQQPPHRPAPHPRQRAAK